MVGCGDMSELSKGDGEIKHLKGQSRRHCRNWYLYCFEYSQGSFFRKAQGSLLSRETGLPRQRATQHP